MQKIRATARKPALCTCIAIHYRAPACGAIPGLALGIRHCLAHLLLLRAEKAVAVGRHAVAASTAALLAELLRCSCTRRPRYGWRRCASRWCSSMHSSRRCGRGATCSPGCCARLVQPRGSARSPRPLPRALHDIHMRHVLERPIATVLVVGLEYLFRWEKAPRAGLDETALARGREGHVPRGGRTASLRASSQSRLAVRIVGRVRGCEGARGWREGRASIRSLLLPFLEMAPEVVVVRQLLAPAA